LPSSINEYACRPFYQTFVTVLPHRECLVFDKHLEKMDPTMPEWRRYLLVQPPITLLLLALSMSGNKPIIRLSTQLYEHFFCRYYYDRSDTAAYVRYGV